MKFTKNHKILLSLSAAVLLVVIITIIVAKRRGRKDTNTSPMTGNASMSDKMSALFGKKVEIADGYKDAVLCIYYNDFQNYHYFDKTLRYVIIPQNADVQRDDEGNEFVEVAAVGYLLLGKLKRITLAGKAYIRKNLLKPF